VPLHDVLAVQRTPTYEYTVSTQMHSCGKPKMHRATCPSIQWLTTSPWRHFKMELRHPITKRYSFYFIMGKESPDATRCV